MQLREMIYKRKSTRSYTDAPVDPATLQQIQAFSASLKPLYPDIRVRAEIVARENVKCICPWTTKQLIAIFSEPTDGYLENVGFLYQQLDLYLHTLGLGACWLGLGKLNAKNTIDVRSKDDLQFVILLAFGHPKQANFRQDATDFKRKALEMISDRQDTRLEPARLAPSSVNSQPWYFTHGESALHAYCVQKSLFGKKTYLDMNRIDMGIALAHMYLANPDTFRFFKAASVPSLKGYGYIGSFCI